MNLNHKYYIPVLKIKQNEKAALSQIDLQIKPFIIPLLEVVERDPAEKTLDQHLITTFKQLSSSLIDYGRCFIDTREIGGDGEPGARQVFQQASALGIPFTPITGLSRIADRIPALEHRTNGIALRVSREELEGHPVSSELQTFLTQNALGYEEVDLILDLGPVNTMIMPGITSLIDHFLASVPNPNNWRTLAISACAFPDSMGGIERNSAVRLPRRDWIAWRDHLYTRRDSLPRLPLFSDCAIQHTSGVEGFNPRLMQSSASIRYTLPEDWLIIKGQGTRTQSPSQQFPILAQQLIGGGFNSSFHGAGHCQGCSDIVSAAHGANGLGSAGTWRRIGTVHHITKVMQDLHSLPGL